jgi:predicted nucleotidyltransferase
VATFPGIDAICLYGSVARGDATEWSDIDLLVTGSDGKLTPERLRKVLSRQDWDRVSLIYYPTAAFREHYQERALFIAHVRKEGVPLFDRLKILRRMLASPYTPVVDVSEGIKMHMAKLAPYADSRKFNDNFLFGLAHLYSIGKGVVMLGLAKSGILEFNRETAFKTFRSQNPDLEREISKIMQLRPFYTLVTGRQPEALLLPPRRPSDAGCGCGYSGVG